MSAVPTIHETIILKADLFKGLKNDSCKLPNMLYELYENKFGITIHSADEKLRAMLPTTNDISLLNIDPGTPLLEIERVAYTLDKTPIELRISRCNTKSHHYHNTLF